jgi:hypothetical protein
MPRFVALTNRYKLNIAVSGGVLTMDAEIVRYTSEVIKIIEQIINVVSEDQ